MSRALSDARAARYTLPAIAFALAAITVGGTLPTPLYPIYADAMTFGPLTVTVLFAIYAFGVLGALVASPMLAAVVGPRTVILAALAAAAGSSGLFLVAGSTVDLGAARVMSGVSVGLAAGCATAMLIDGAPSQQRARAARLAAGINTGGLASGALVAGLLTDRTAPATAWVFALHLTLICAATVGVVVLPDAGRARTAPVITRPRVPTPVRGHFPAAVFAPGIGFAVLGVLTAMSGLLLGVLDVNSHTLTAVPTFVGFAGMAVGQVLGGRIPLLRAVALAAAAGVASSVLLVLSAHLGWFALLGSAALIGIPSGVGLAAGVTATVGAAPSPSERAAAASVFYANLYALLAMPAVLSGFAAHRFGLLTAGAATGAALASVAALGGVILARRTGKRESPR